MSDLDKFLREARCKVSAAAFDRRLAAGQVSEEELANQIVFVGNPESPLVVKRGFKTVDAWYRYWSNYVPDYDPDLTALLEP